MKAFALAISVVFLFIQANLYAQEELNYSYFPESTYWVNVEYKLAPSTFKDKILVVLCWDMTDPIGRFYCEKLENLSKKAQHMQLVSIVKGDAEHLVSLSDLKAFVQDNSIYHPLGIAGDMYPFANVLNESLPKIFVFTKNQSQPTIYNFNDGRTLIEIIGDLEKMLYDRNFTKDYSYWQMKPTQNPDDFAMPTIAYPSFLSSSSINKTLYIAENNQHRISGYAANGTLKDLVGGDFGDVSGTFNSVKIGSISGMEYDDKSDLLYFVDASFNKLKSVDFSSEMVYEVKLIDNSRVSRQMVDVTLRDTSLFVLSAFPAAITEYSAKSNVKLNEVTIQGNLNFAERVTKISKGLKNLYVVTSLGRIFAVRNGVVELFYNPNQWDEAAFDIVEIKKATYILLSRKNEVIKLENAKMKLLYSTPLVDSNIFDEIREDVLKVSHSLCAFNGGLVLSDLGNNMIRLINLKKKKTTIFEPVFSEKMSMSRDAVAGGEQVYFEQSIFGNGTNQVEFVFELGGLKLYSGGRNEVALEESAGIELAEGGVTEKGFTISITPREESNYAQMEIYLTLFDPAFPLVLYFKRAVLNVEYQVISGEETSHSFFYRPNVKAY